MALSLGLPPLGITQHPALWSSDFPPAARRQPAIIWPAPRPFETCSLSEVKASPKFILPRRWLLVNALIGQVVRQAVLSPRHVGDRIRLELLQLIFGRAPEGEEVGSLDAILTEELSHQQFGIGKDLELADPESGGLLQPQNQGLVLRHVVGGFA